MYSVSMAVTYSKDFLCSKHRCFLDNLLSRGNLLCLTGTQKEAATNAPTSLSFLLFTVVTHARSDQVSNITASEETNPLFHSASPPPWIGCRWNKVQTLRSIQFRQDRGSREPWLFTQLSGGTPQLNDRQRERGAGGRVMLCERMQRVCLSSSCPWVYWSVIALKGGGRSPAPALPSITRGWLESAQHRHG